MPSSKSNNIAFHIIVLLIIFYISTASVLHNRFIPFYIGILFLAYQLVYKKDGFKTKFTLLLIAWIGINLFATVTSGVGFFYQRIIMNTMILIFLPYLLLRIMGDQFWIIIEKWIFRFTILSLPLWLFSNLYPEVFIDLKSFFETTTNSNFLGNKNYWSAIIYTYASMDNGYGINRNCGFMWEPGAFSLMIIWSIIYNWLKSDKMVFNFRIWVYIIALITTFSTAGYFALIFLLLGYYFKKITFSNIALMIGIIILFYSVVYELDFISGKLNKYNQEFAQDPTGQNTYTGKKVNRFQGGVAAVVRTLKLPSGYGLVSAFDTEDNWYAYGTNGLGSMLEMWGFFMFPVLIYLIYKSLKVLNMGQRGNLTIYIFFIALMIELFSNPIHRSLIIYILIITPIALEAKSIKINRVPELNFNEGQKEVI